MRDSVVLLAALAVLGWIAGLLALMSITLGVDGQFIVAVVTIAVLVAGVVGYKAAGLAGVVKGLETLKKGLEPP